MNTRKYICVFCGSSETAAVLYKEEANLLAKAMVENGFGLVYGGSNVGLMNVMANKVMEYGGHVIGVTTPDVTNLNVDHQGIELITKPTLDERKKEMLALSDGCISLPGGFGTFDELHWLNIMNQFSIYHDKNDIKPHAIFNIKDFYNGTIEQINRSIKEGFIKDSHLHMLYFSNDANKLVKHIANYKQPVIEKTRWWESHEMPSVITLLHSSPKMTPSEKSDNQKNVVSFKN